MTPSTHRSRPGLRHNRYAKGFLSSLLPGLGQMAGRELNAGALFLAPALLLGMVALSIVLTTDKAVLGARLIDPSVVLALLAVQVAILVWRVLAVSHALGIRMRRPRHRLRFGTAALLTFVVVPQLVAGALTFAWYGTTTRIFSGGADYVPAARASLPAVDPSDDPFGRATTGPDASLGPLPEDGRVTVLLIGVDSGADRATFNTDTMIVASLDPGSKTVSMLSIPRDMVDVPLGGGDGRIYTRKINSLAAWAKLHPEQFPDARGGNSASGEAVLAAALSQLTGVKIDYWAEVNLPGLVRVVDSVGGIDVSIKRAFCDPYYHEYGEMGFAVLPGRYHMNGNEALAYARVRHPLGESDFTRAERQQEVVVALRDRVVGGGFLNDPLGLMQSLGDTISTNIPADEVSRYASLATSITRGRVYSAVVSPPLVTGASDARGSIQIPDIAGIRALAASLFTRPGDMPESTPMGDTIEQPAPALPQLNCFAPKPPPGSGQTPSASPTPAGSPDASPSGEPSGGPSASPAPSLPATPGPTDLPGTTPAPSPTIVVTPAPTPPVPPKPTPSKASSGTPTAHP